MEGYSNEITRIAVGNTLPIYIIRPESEDNLSDGVALIGMAGKTDGDANNCNRYRLVVSIAEGIAHGNSVSERFSNVFTADEKMHIHFVREELLDGL